MNRRQSIKALLGTSAFAVVAAPVNQGKSGNYLSRRELLDRNKSGTESLAHEQSPPVDVVKGPKGPCPKCGQPDAFHHPRYQFYEKEWLEWNCLRCHYGINTPVLTPHPDDL